MHQIQLNNHKKLHQYHINNIQRYLDIILIICIHLCRWEDKFGDLEILEIMAGIKGND
jgi:hypothetical protein